MSELALYLKDVTVFQDKRIVLTDVNLEVSYGEFIYIIGKTGSGKSSLMKTLYGDLPLKKGEGSISDFDLASLTDRQIPFLRRKLGIVFQDFKLLSDRNIIDNMLFVLKATGWKNKDSMMSKIDEVLDKISVKELADKMPHQLSGGEQQRIAIARALLNDPDIILADEPTGNLDPQTSLEILDMLHRVNATGKTVIMATHDYASLLKFPAKMLKCEDEKIFEVQQRK